MKGKVLAAGARLAQIDLLRGLVIVLMALDHVRDYFHAGAFRYDALDPEQTTALLYATRWMTHLCAPGFVFLAGVAAYLQYARGKPRPTLSRFLLTRGLWLVFLELTVCSFGWSFAVPYALFLQVIWAIGWSMVALAALVWLPRSTVLAIGVAIAAGHNLLDPLAPAQFGPLSTLWVVLHEGGLLKIGDTPVGFVAYPLLPWAGVIAIGYGLGPLFLEAAPRRDRVLLVTGLGMLALAAVLRAANGYGDPEPWRAHGDALKTAMSVLDVNKYPPSLMYLLIMLGLCFLLLPALARLRGPLARVLGVFGEVPLFFYLLHIYLVHLLSIAANAAAGRDVSGLFGYIAKVFMAPELFAGLGFSLATVYLAWIGVLVLLYLPCRWWAGVKARRRDWWLSYL